MTVEFSKAANNSFSRSECAKIYISGEEVGVMGRVSPKILRGFDIKDEVYLLEADLDAVLKHVKTERRFAELSKYPSVYRDISILVAKKALNSEIVSAMTSAGSPLLKGGRLIDRYEGKQVPEGKQSLTYRLEYCDPARTLEEKDILNVHGRILGELETKFGAKLR